MTIQVTTLKTGEFFLTRSLDDRIVASAVRRGRLTEGHIHSFAHKTEPYTKIGMWKQIKLLFQT